MKVRVGYGLGQPAAARRRTARRAGRGHRGARLRLAVAVGADQRARARSGARSHVRGGAHPQDQARHERVGASRAAARRSSPRSGRRSTCSRAVARCPRSGSASRIRSSNRRSASRAATAPRSSTRRSRCCAGLWAEDAVDHDGTWFHYEGMTRAAEAGAPARRVARRQGAVGAAPRRPARRRLARVVRDARSSARRHAPVDRGRGRRRRSRDRPRALRRRWSSTRTTSCPNSLVQVLASRNPDVDPHDLVARGWPAVRELCERYVAVGFSKLVLVPFAEPKDWDDELAAGAAEVLPLQT